jgi:predicted SAM-dependent methyltransferase
LIQKTGRLELHLGCGDKHFPGMLNCEFRATKAADLVMDCGNLSKLCDGSVDRIFSHAFFEHLYKRQQVPLLRDCFRVLREGGVVVFLGIPDMQEIAGHYLSKSRGIVSEIFDLYHVYRYTHGDPEMAPHYWTEQLHKSIFDKDYLKYLLCAAGFKHNIIFNYCYPGESIAINIGFIGYKSSCMPNTENVAEVLSPFKEYIDNLDELIIA